LLTYASLNGNRSNYGLQTPVAPVFHDAANGYGGFASFIFNRDSRNQYRVVASLRQDYYQIPIDPNPNSIGNSIYPSYGLRDGEREPDGYVTFSWVHTFNPDTLLTVSPFYHYNGANYQGGTNDFPVISTVTQTANYAGMQAALNVNFWKNDLEAGVYGFGQHQYNYFYNQYTDGTPNVAPSSIGASGGVTAVFINDKFKVTPWLTFIAGLRETAFDASISENATDPVLALRSNSAPELGVSRLLRLLLSSAATRDGNQRAAKFGHRSGFCFRSSARRAGYRVAVWRHHSLSRLESQRRQLRNQSAELLDHNNIGESNIFWPITWDAALIQGWELTLRSPSIAHHGQFHLAYANQIAQATSPITGGLICPTSPPTPSCGLDIPPGLAPVDHDQRNTLNVGFNANLPWHSYASTNVYYGSGFTNGQPGVQYPGDYLPGHTTFDLALGKSFAENTPFHSPP